MKVKPTLSQAKLEQLENLAKVAEQAAMHIRSVTELRIVAYEATCRAEQAEVKGNAAWTRYMHAFNIAAEQYIADHDADNKDADNKPEQSR